MNFNEKKVTGWGLNLSRSTASHQGTFECTNQGVGRGEKKKITEKEASCTKTVKSRWKVVLGVWWSSPRAPPSSSPSSAASSASAPSSSSHCTNTHQSVPTFLKQAPSSSPVLVREHFICYVFYGPIMLFFFYCGVVREQKQGQLTFVFGKSYHSIYTSPF